MKAVVPETHGQSCLYADLAAASGSRKGRGCVLRRPRRHAVGSCRCECRGQGPDSRRNLATGPAGLPSAAEWKWGEVPGRLQDRAHRAGRTAMDEPVLCAPLVIMRACKQEFTVLPDCLLLNWGYCRS